MTKIGILEDRRSYSRELNTLFKLEMPSAEIHVYNSVDDAIAALEIHKNWDFWVVDLMMPPGNKMGKLETQDGLATGTRFIDIMMKKNIEVQKSIVVLTSRNTDDDQFELKSFNIIEFQKSHVTQVEVVQEISRLA